MIKLYTHPHCPHSRAAKKFFELRKIAYEEISVYGNEEAYEEMIKRSHQQKTPVTEINNRVFVGFHSEAFKKELGIKKPTALRHLFGKIMNLEYKETVIKVKVKSYKALH